ncbi:MAG: type II secretion system protein [Pseudomonadota bacterium]
MTAWPRTPRPSAGFTLLELIVVVAIIGLLVGLVGPRLTLPYRPPKPDIAIFLEKQRLKAIEDGSKIRIVLGARELVALPHGQRFPLAPGTTLVIDRPAPTAYLAAAMVTEFYPDGTAILSSFRLFADDGGRPAREFARIEVNPLRGTVSYATP